MSGIPQIVGRACLEKSSVTPAMLVRRPLPSSARHEATSRQQGRRAQRPWSQTVARRRRPLCLGSGHRPNGPSSREHRILHQPRRSRRRRNGHITRRIDHAEQSRDSGRQPRAHVLAAIQGARVHPARRRQSSGRLSSVVGGAGNPPRCPMGTPGRSFSRGELELAGDASPTPAATHHHLPPTVPKARHGGLRRGWLGSRPNRTDQCFASPATWSRCAQTRWSVAGAAHSIVGLCCCTPQSSKSEAACGNDTDSPSWPVNVLLDRQARDCGVSAGPTCRDRSPKAAEGAEGVERYKWQNFKQFRRHWRVEPS